MHAALVDEYQELISTGGERFVHPFVFLVHTGRNSALRLRSGLMTTASCWQVIGTNESVFYVTDESFFNGVTSPLREVTCNKSNNVHVYFSAYIYTACASHTYTFELLRIMQNDV